MTDPQKTLGGMGITVRLGLVALVQLCLLGLIGLGTVRSSYVAVLGMTVAITILVVSVLALTLQAHRRVPIAWHGLVMLAAGATLALVPWSERVLDGQRTGGFDSVYWSALAWIAVVVVETACVLAFLRADGDSYRSARTRSVSGS